MPTEKLNAVDNATLDALRRSLPKTIAPLIQAAFAIRRQIQTHDPQYHRLPPPIRNQFLRATEAADAWLTQAGAQLLLDTPPDQLYLPLAQPDSPPCPEGDEAGSPDSPNTQTPQSDGP